MAETMPPSESTSPMRLEAEALEFIGQLLDHIASSQGVNEIATHLSTTIVLVRSASRRRGLRWPTRGLVSLLYELCPSMTHECL